MFAAAKDKLAGQAAKAYLQDLIKAYGRVETLTLDSTGRRILVRCRLDGELEAIEVCIERYALDRDPSGARLRVLECTASRRWLQAVLSDHLVGRPIALPAWAAAAL